MVTTIGCTLQQGFEPVRAEIRNHRIDQGSDFHVDIAKKPVLVDFLCTFVCTYEIQRYPL